MTGRAKETVVETQQGEEILALPPLEALREVLGRCRVPDIAGLPPLRGGFVGYLAFEGVTAWERVRGMHVPLTRWCCWKPSFAGIWRYWTI